MPRRIVIAEPRLVLHGLDLGPQQVNADPRRLSPDTWHPRPDHRPRAPYRKTAKSRAASLANLQRAWVAKKRDHSPNYAPGFLQGYQAADPTRCLSLSGATLEEYRTHLAVYRIGLQPANARQEKLAQATAMVSWKWLTGFRLYGDSEVLAVKEILERLARERQAAAPLTPGRLMELVRELHRVFDGWLEVDRQAEPVYHRLLQLLRQGIVERGGEKTHLRGLWPSRRVEDFFNQALEVLTTPGRAAKKVLAAMAPEPATVREPQPGPAESKARQVASAATNACAASERPTRPRGPAEEARRTLARERRERERQRYGPVRRARQEGREIPGKYEDFVRLVEAALGESGGDAVGAGPCARPQGLGYGVPGGQVPGPDAAQPEPSQETGQAQGPAPTPDAAVRPDPDAQLVREMADALWQRMTVFRRYAGKLERELCLQLIAWANDPAVPYDRQGPVYARELAWEGVGHAFGHFAAKAAKAATALEKRIEAACYALSVERWGRTAECASLAESALPDLNDRYWAWQVTHPKPGMELPNLDFTDSADPLLRAVELLRGAGVEVGKTIPPGYETS